MCKIAYHLFSSPHGISRWVRHHIAHLIGSLYAVVFPADVLGLSWSLTGICLSIGVTPLPGHPSVPVDAGDRGVPASGEPLCFGGESPPGNR